MILSCVRAGSNTPGIGFLSDKRHVGSGPLGVLELTKRRRMNVALTRAQSSLIVVGDQKRLNVNRVCRQLIDDAREKDMVFSFRLFCAATTPIDAYIDRKKAPKKAKARQTATGVLDDITAQMLAPIKLDSLPPGTTHCSSPLTVSSDSGEPDGELALVSEPELAGADSSIVSLLSEIVSPPVPTSEASSETRSEESEVACQTISSSAVSHMSSSYELVSASEDAVHEQGSTDRATEWLMPAGYCLI